MRASSNCSIVLDYRDGIKNDEPTARMEGLTLEFVTRMVSAPLAIIRDDIDPSRPRFIVVKADSILGSDSEFLGREYLETLADDDPILVAGARGERISLVDAEGLMKSPGFPESTFATSFLAGNGLGPVLALYLVGRDEVPGCALMLIRSVDEADFSDREKGFLRHMAPVLAHSHRTSLDVRPAVNEKTTESMRGAAAMLTPREQEIAPMAAHGARNDEIGERLHISTETVKTHLRNIYSKLDVDSRIHLSMRLTGH